MEKEHSGELSRDGGWAVDACVQRIASQHKGGIECCHAISDRQIKAVIGTCRFPKSVNAHGCASAARTACGELSHHMHIEVERTTVNAAWLS